MQGIVKWFDPTKGFGFIAPSDGSKDIFVHKNDIPEGLRDGDRVEFEVAPEAKGPKAKNVKLLD